MLPLALAALLATGSPRELQAEHAQSRRGDRAMAGRAEPSQTLRTASSHAFRDPPAPHERPRVGVALGGGSAKGLAHIGVLRWFEEHRIPIDFIAGTSMGGLVGGAYAAGISTDELSALIRSTDWDEMFGGSAYRYKNVRRKQDARAFPARLEFGIRGGGVVPPVALNNGMQVDRLLASIGGAYGELRTFDELPTPFRCVAVDLVRSEAVVLDHGHLPHALRATMSLPGVFPPVQDGERVLVDGGALNNLPVDVVRAMGADVVVAVRVGSAREERAVAHSIFGVASATLAVMMEVNTRRSMAAADVVINPSLDDFGRLDWRRAGSLEEAGYRAAEAMKDVLLPLALDESAWSTHLSERRARRPPAPPVPAHVVVMGATPADARHIESALRRHVGVPLDAAAIARDLDRFAGLDRYQTITWHLVAEEGRTGLAVRAVEKLHAPPYLMLGVHIDNATTDVFAFQLAARYLAFDALGRGSELRLDGAVGSRPHVAAELVEPLFGAPLFAALSAGLFRHEIEFARDGDIVAQYEDVRAVVGLDAGVELGTFAELRAGVITGPLRTEVRTGDPRLPDLSGWETRVRLHWLHDGQDRVVVPTRGTRASFRVGHILAAPAAETAIATDRTNDGLTQTALNASTFWSRGGDRIFLVLGGGTSFGDDPLPTEQFTLGGPLRVGSYDLGELRNDHYGLLTMGYLKGLGRLPDFLGGPVFAGLWLENGSTFDDVAAARLHTSVSAGVVLDTLLGPAALGVSFGDNRRLRPYVSIGGFF
jgi:NTE family protein